MADFIDDFERDGWNPAVDPTPWTTYTAGASGGMGIVTSHARSGTRSLHGKAKTYGASATSFLTQTLPLAKTEAWQCAYLTVTGITLPEGAQESVISANGLGYVGFKKVGGVLYWAGLYQQDSGSTAPVSSVVLTPDAVTCVEIHYKSATGVGANNGIYEVFLDGILAIGVYNIDNDTKTNTATNLKSGGPATVEKEWWIDKYVYDSTNRQYPDSYPLVVTGGTVYSMVVSGGYATSEDIEGLFQVFLLEWEGQSSLTLDYSIDNGASWTSLEMLGNSYRPSGLYIRECIRFRVALASGLSFGGLRVSSARRLINLGCVEE
jgi:hypothetical protein